jgi:cyclophilin family peptidyl-prolyl cis-trans isomerase
MSKYSASGRIGVQSRTNRAKKPISARTRRPAFEGLEPRQLLSTVAAPTSIQFEPQSNQGTATLTSANNASSTATMQFLVSGVTAGDTVNVYADGGTTAIGTGTVASGATTITVTTGGTSRLADGVHTFTATQTANSVASASSPADSLQIFTDLTLSSDTAASATVGKAFTYTAQTSVPSGDVATIAAGSTLLSGMTFNASTDTFSGWTPTSSEAGTTQSFTVALSDTIGNSTTVTVFVGVAGASGVSAIAPPANIAIGSPVLVALNSADAGTPSFSVTTSSSSDPTGADLTATILPQTNQVLQIVTNYGDIDIELLNNYTPNTVAHFVSLVDSGTYTGTSFYRIIQSFMDQGGSGGTGSTIPVELNPNLRFTSSGLLAMANNGVDGNSSEFFITNPDDMSDGFLDFRYTVFGKLIAGDNVRQAIAATPVEYNSATPPEYSQPLTPPVIESMSIVTAPSDGVLMLSALAGATGTYTVNVSDGHGGTTSFTITLGTNAYDPPNPWVTPINGTDTITTAENTPVTFTPSGKSVTAAGSPAPQVDVQLYEPVPSVANAYVDNSYVPTISGSFELQVGTATTSAIDFDSMDPTTTASDIQTALQALSGLSATTVTANTPTPGTNPTTFTFTVTFAASETPITYDSSASDLEADFKNSAAAAAETQTLTFLYAGPVADAANPYVTLTPATGYQGIQFLEVTAVTPLTGTFELQVGSATTSSINFDSTNLAGTAANMQTALDQLTGLGGTTVTAVTPVPTLSPTDFSFSVTFPSSQSLASYVATTTALPVTMVNSSVAPATTQVLTFAESSPGTSWDANSQVSPVYRAYVPVLIGAQAAAPAAPQISSITVGGKAVTGGHTFANNISSATELSFVISGAVAGDTVLVYMDGGASPIAGGTAATGSTTITVTTNGTTRIADGSHVFTVKQETPEATLYSDFSINSSGGFGPAAQYSVPSSSVQSAASAGTTLSIGLQVLTLPNSAVQVGVPYTYVVQTNAPAGDTVTVTPVNLPAGMQFNGVATFTWTPTNAQLNTAPTFSATVSDTQGHSTTIGPLSISVIIGLPPVQVPVNSSFGGNVTVSFIGSQVEVYDNVGKAVLVMAPFKSTDVISLDLPSGQANSVSIAVPKSASAVPREILVQGVSGATKNQVIVVGTGGGNTFTVAGSTVTGNGLAMQMAAVQKLTLDGCSGNDYYTLTSSSVPVSIVDPGGSNTLDFSHDAAGVTVNLGLNGGQAQSIAPWGTTLAISGVINKLIGSQFNDVLTGGPAAVTEILAGGGNDTITGGSGDNILLGGGGSDTIVGGRGRNLLIAGSGNCSLYANGSQNIVFAGSTNIDSNDQALLNLLEEGPLVMYSYMYRRALIAVARTPALQASMLALQDSGAHDTIFGSRNIDNLFVLGRNGTIA